MSTHPYSDLPESAFWRSAVAEKHLLDITDIWRPKFDIRANQQVATYGSCFAQHIGIALKTRGFQWLIAEPPPYAMSQDDARLFNYGIFSARTGNIYTTSLLHQWARWAAGSEKPPEEVWLDGDRVIDPFRPRIERGGFASVSEMQASRAQAIGAFRESIEKANVFVFTLGLTESWKNTAEGYEYPMCPGTVGGTFDPNCHAFENQEYISISKQLRSAIKLLRGMNKRLRFILTVSPVPLTATNSGHHVVVANSYSKSVLRAVAGDVYHRLPYVDYFPSYEIFTAPPFRGVFYDPNLRTPSKHGVAHAMDVFFGSMKTKVRAKPRRGPRKPRKTGDGAAQVKSADVICEEELLEAFR